MTKTRQYISGDTMIAHGSHIAGYEALLDLRSHDMDSESQEYALDLAVATQIVRNFCLISYCCVHIDSFRWSNI